MTANETDTRRENWERAADVPLTVIALLFLAGYAWPILDPSLSADWVTVCGVVVWATWAVFAVEYVVRFTLSSNRAAFLRRSWLDLLTVILPLLRPLRLLRVVLALSALNRAAGSALRGHLLVYVVASTVLVLFVAALAVLDAERGAADANIGTFKEALWWAATTVTTVGYGDQFPVTDGGRLVAVGLMLAGIALLGVVTGSFASWLIQRVAAVEEQAQAATRRDILELSARIDELRTEVHKED